jgi:hypothetical protein
LLWDTEEGATGNPAVTVSGNTVGNSQVAIYAVNLNADGDGGDYVSITGNKILGTSTYNGIYLCTNGNTVKGNTIFNSAISGVYINSSCPESSSGASGNGNIVTGNTILESECAGILADSGTTNTTTPDTYFTVPVQVATSPGNGPINGGNDTCTAPNVRAKTTTHKVRAAR